MISEPSLRTWCEIDLDAMLHNFMAARHHLPDEVLLAAVIKANAYGHGAVAAAKLLEGKADRFAVAMTDEAVELRKAGIETPIFLLAPTPESDFEAIARYDIEAAVPSFAYGKALCAYGAAHGKTIPYHVALDTGMGRIGFACTDDSLDEIEALSRLPGGRLLGVFSHYAKADALDKAYAREQTRRYKAFTEAMEQRGIEIPLKHLDNSAGLVEMPDKFDMVREGIILYGLKPSSEVDLSLIGGVKGVMALRSHISFLKTVAAPTPVSYGCTYVAQPGTRVATVSAGYADGVNRLLSNKGQVLVRGIRCPIIGRVCMDQFMIDVTGVPEAQVGDTVTIFGRDGDDEITADDVADMIGTIGYEVTCLVTPRVPRVYVQDGAVVSVHRPLID
ncbi:MAG: alanine racemase [Clostridia bacterium]|nr:alanine racemase [Clostridia bacterium]